MKITSITACYDALDEISNVYGLSDNKIYIWSWLNGRWEPLTKKYELKEARKRLEKSEKARKEAL